ncbi:hypothetical protein [Pseudomonas sp. FW300-N2E2]|nr:MULTISPECIES: hypothetical protein [Pseudomonas]
MDIRFKSCDQIVERFFVCCPKLGVEKFSNSDVFDTYQSRCGTSSMQPRPLSIAATLSEKLSLKKSGNVMLSFSCHVVPMTILSS